MKQTPDPPSADNNGTLPPATALLSGFLCVLFGANAVAVKFSLAGLGVFTTAGLRFSLAALVILSWARLTGKPLAINKKQAWQLAALATIFFVQISMFYQGQSRTTASHGTLIGNLLPFWVMFLAHFLLPGDRITLRKLLGLLAGFCGVLLLFFDSATSTGSSLTGDLIILGAVLVWGGNVIYVKRITAAYHPVQITVYPMVMAIPLYFLAGLLFDEPMVGTLSWPVLAGLGYQSLVTASFGFLVWNTLIQRYGATALHSFLFIMPLSGVTFGVLLLGEPLTDRLLAAIILVSLGLLIVNFRTRG